MSQKLHSIFYNEVLTHEGGGRFRHHIPYDLAKLFVADGPLKKKKNLPPLRTL